MDKEKLDSDSLAATPERPGDVLKVDAYLDLSHSSPSSSSSNDFVLMEDDESRPQRCLTIDRCVSVDIRATVPSEVWETHRCRQKALLSVFSEGYINDRLCTTIEEFKKRACDRENELKATLNKCLKLRAHSAEKLTKLMTQCMPSSWKSGLVDSELAQQKVAFNCEVSDTQWYFKLEIENSLKKLKEEMNQSKEKIAQLMKVVLRKLEDELVESVLKFEEKITEIQVKSVESQEECIRKKKAWEKELSPVLWTCSRIRMKRNCGKV